MKQKKLTSTIWKRKPRLSIKYWEKLFKAKAETAFDGIHGYIVILNGNTDRYKSVTLDYLSKGPGIVD